MGLDDNNTPPVIELKGLKKSFGIGDAERFALNGVDLSINKGEFIAIMGPSGCGKTSLLNILGLLSRASDGEYRINGEPVSQISKRRQARIRSQQIGFIFQNFNLIPRLNIVENVAMPLLYRGGMGATKRLERASELLRNFHLNEREYYMPHQLSGGQVQRVAIARALMNNPSIILADEPTGNLDTQASHIVMEELADLHRRGNTIIMVTHNPELTTYASRVITMLDGEIDTDSVEGFEKKTSFEHTDMFQPIAVAPEPEVKTVAETNQQPEPELPPEFIEKPDPQTDEEIIAEESMTFTIPVIHNTEPTTVRKKRKKPRHNKKSKNKSKKRNR
jgi:putative ABC transport system ATP-binding protein